MLAGLATAVALTGLPWAPSAGARADALRVRGARHVGARSRVYPPPLLALVMGAGIALLAWVPHW